MLLLVLVLSGFALLGALFPTTVMPHPALKAFRILFPSWRFFEEITPIPKVFFRVNSALKDKVQNNSLDNSQIKGVFDERGDLESAWQPLLFPEIPRGVSELFHNPTENLQIAFRVQLEQLLNDIAEQDLNEPQEIEALASYQIVHRTLCARIKTLYPQHRLRYQYKISVLEFKNSESEEPENGCWTEALLSAEMED